MTGGERMRKLRPGAICCPCGGHARTRARPAPGLDRLYGALAPLITVSCHISAESIDCPNIRPNAYAHYAGGTIGATLNFSSCACFYAVVPYCISPLAGRRP
jgi:hypothetical protein